MDYNFSLTPLIVLGAITVAFVWGCWELVDWLWIDDAIKTTTPIIPEIELIVNENQIDTLYVYRKP